MVNLYPHFGGSKYSRKISIITDRTFVDENVWPKSQYVGFSQQPGAFVPDIHVYQPKDAAIFWNILHINQVCIHRPVDRSGYV